MPQISVTPTQNRQDKVEIKKDAIIQELQTRSPAEIKTWINNNVTDLPSARLVLTSLAIIVGEILKERDFTEVG